MKRFSSRQRDDAFGQSMLALWTSLGLTQAELAERLRVSGRAVREWEAGSSYPKAPHLQHVITLAVQQQAFPPGREAEEIRALWKAGRQKVLLDEQWLSTLLGRSRPSLELVAPRPSASVPAQSAVAARAATGPRVDWGDALDVPSFYGREQELAQLSQWVLQERCRVASLWGMGGIGKSALVVHVMHRLAEHFEVVIFRSLRDAPSCEALLEACLQVLSPESLALLPQGLERRLNLLLEKLRTWRVLLVLDNLESLLSEGDVRGRLRPGYEGYGRLLRQVAQTGHQSCLLLTSREKPAELRGLEGSRTLVRALRLSGLDAMPGEQLLASCGDDGSVCLWAASDGALLQRLQGHNSLVASVVWSPDGARLASSGGGRGELFVWDAHSGERLQALSGHPGSVFAVDWSQLGDLLVSGGSDGMLRWWDVQRGKCLMMRETHQGAVQSLRISSDGRMLASCDDDSTIKVWDLENGEYLRTLRRDRPYERLDITGVKGLTEAQKATLRRLGAVENLS